MRLLKFFARGRGIGAIAGGSSGSQITISVVHPGAIQEQNPYLALDTQRSGLDRAIAQKD